jgi:serine phosphatase RsbU (regulator of sigma subunit)/hemoglobin-like flavoprotein
MNPGHYAAATSDVAAPPTNGRTTEIEASLAKVLACTKPPFAEVFYRALFQRHPRFTHMFRHTNMQTQRAMLPVALQMVVNCYRHPTPAGEDYLRSLGRKHQSIGVQAEDFQDFGEVLLGQLAEFHGSDWTQVLANQWRTAYVAATRLMFEGLTDGGEPGNQLEMLAELVINASVRSEELRHLHELVEQINRGLDLEDVLNYVYEQFRDVIPYNRIGFATIDEKKNTAVARWSRSDRPVRLDPPYEARLQGSTLALIVETGSPRIISDLRAYLQLKPKSVSTRLIVEEGMRSSLTCPLIAHGRPVGFVFFSSVDVGAYNDAHIQLFQHIVGELSVIVEKASLYSTLKEQAELIERQNREFLVEMRLARELQRSLIPRRAVSPEGLAIGFVYDPLLEIGGDILDMFELSDGRTLIFVADAMGHGVRGAMIMAVAKSALHNAVRETDEPTEILGRINHQLFHLVDGVFVTAVCMILDPARHTLKAAIAGHPFPWHFRSRDGQMTQFESTGIPLGIESTFSDTTITASLEKGDVLLICTDGLLEALSPQGKQYGDQRVSDLLREHAAMNAPDLCQRIRDDLKRHRGSVLADDDVSLVAVQVL